mmetsp:Transcript_116287/g.276409  ORF Transcript_116287/g.276409 Transcript_116287/m.276409 type:complete len:384 (+) Transcript_116287:128-1279(+)
MVAIIRSAHGHLRVGDTVLAWVDHLAPVAIANELELLLAGEPQADVTDPQAGILGAPNHILKLPGTPGAHHGVVMVEVGDDALEEPRRGSTDHLPCHHPVLPTLPGEAPLQLDQVHGASTGAIFLAVDQPAGSLAPLVWPHRRMPVARQSFARVQYLVRVLIHQQSEMLPACLTELDHRRILAEDLFLHLPHACEGIPRAGDVDLIAGVGSWVPVVEDTIVEELSAHHPLARVEELGSPTSPDRPAPEVAPGVGAAEAEGGDTGDARLGAVVGELVGKVDWVAVGVHVRVQTPEVVVGRASAAVQQVDALQDACHASRGLEVPQVRLRRRVEDGKGPILHDHTQSTDLDGVSQSCARAVALGHIDLRGREFRLQHRGSYALLL